MTESLSPRRSPCWRRAPLVVGHRGGRGAGWPPENTMAAFERARAEGADAVELDARTCAGGQVVVFHDDTLERMTEGRDRRRVQQVGFGELSGLDLGGGATVPLLAEVLSWARRTGMGVNVELKSHAPPSRAAFVRAVSRVAAEHDADLLVSSFDPLLLMAAIAAGLRGPRALITGADPPLGVRLARSLARPPAVWALHLPSGSIDAGAVGRHAARGLRVGAWTVNDPDQALRLVALGVAWVITDCPGVLRAALGPPGS